MLEDISDCFLNIVIEAFLTEMPSRLEFLRSALARGDDAAMHGQARSLKSAGAFISLGRFKGLCRELIALASAGDTAGAAALLSDIEAEYARVEEDLQRRLDLWSCPAG